MFVSKCFIPLLILCLAQGSVCKPTANELTQGRGIGSTIWGWLTYPFSWWGSGSTEAPPAPDHLVASSTYGPYDNIEIAKHNVTIWCNDHTCTTMKCEKNACKNTTCNIYDTDVNGRCREYNIGMKPEEPFDSKPSEIAPKPSEVTPIPPVQDKVTVTLPPSSAPEVSSAATTTALTESSAAEHPLELEAALSSTVTEKNEAAIPLGDKLDKSSPQNKI